MRRRREFASRPSVAPPSRGRSRRALSSREDTGDRVYEYRHPRRTGGPLGRISARLKRSRLHREAERHDRTAAGLKATTIGCHGDCGADLVRRQVIVIAATTTPAALAAKAATAIIPIIFETARRPEGSPSGLVGNMNRPGGNSTGVTQLCPELVSKRLGLLHDLIPTAKNVPVCFWNREIPEPSRKQQKCRRRRRRSACTSIS